MEPSAFVSVVAWAPGMTEEDRALALSAATGMDLYLCRPRARHEPPFITARLEGARAREAAAGLESVGIRALAVDKPMIDGVPEAVRAKRLVAAEGAPEPMYLVEPWRGEAVGMKRSDVALIVIGRPEQQTRRVTTRTVPSAGYGGLGGYGGYGGVPEVETETTTNRRRTQVMDVYLRGKRRVRIDSDKFSFDVLGEDRGYTDAENFDKLCLRLCSESPGAIIDDGFERFRKLPELRKVSTEALSNVTVQRKDEKPGFDFYSAWVYVVQVYLQRGAGK